MSRPGRNDPCPCGSGKKYKHCHLGKPDDPGAAKPVSPHFAPGLLPDTYIYDPIPFGPFDDDEIEDDEFEEYDESIPMIQPVDRPADLAYQLIMNVLAERDPKARVPAARQALELNPDCTGAHLLLGIAEPDTGRHDAHFTAAIEAAERALSPMSIQQMYEINPNHPDADCAMNAMLFRSISRISQGRIDDAREDLESIVRADYDNRTTAVTHLIMLELREGNAAAAWEHFRDANKDAPNPTLSCLGALVRFQHFGDTTFARRALAEAMVYHPGRFTSLQLLRTEGAAQRFPSWNDMFHAEDLVPEVGYDFFFTPVLHFEWMTLDALWWLAEDLDEWIQDVRDCGPSALFDNGNLGEGPLLRFVMTKLEEFQHCPVCRRKTHFHKLSTIIRIETGADFLLDLLGRRCNDCDIDLIAEADYFGAVYDKLSDEYECDFFPLGFIVDSDLKGKPRNQEFLSWAQENLRKWRRIEMPDQQFEEWPTEETLRKDLEAFDRQFEAHRLSGPLDFNRGL